MGEMIWSLADPQLGLLERLGVAGMATALDAATRLKHDLGGLQYDTSARDLVLRWPDSMTAKDALTPLIHWAWQTRGATSDKPEEGLGVYYFPAIHEDARDVTKERLVEHSGVLRTFLQHTRTQPKTPVRTLQVEINGHRMTLRYVEPRDSIAHIKNFEKVLFTRKGALLGKPVSCSSFLVPGATARHRGEKSWQGTVAQAIPLFFVATVCFYFRILGKEWVVVAPDVRDLQEMVTLRRKLHLSEVQSYAGSAGDAALRALSIMRSRLMARDIERRQQPPLECEVMQIGEVAWNRQSVRHQALRVRPNHDKYDLYKLLERHMQNQFRPRKEGGEFVSVPTPRGRIAENIVRGNYWYKDLFQIPRVLRKSVERQTRPNESAARAWFRMIGYHNKELRNLMSDMDKQQPNPDDMAFVAAMHEVMRRLFGKESKQSERGTRTAQERFRDLVDRTRRDITRAQTRALLRSTLSSFFASAGQIPALQDNYQQIWIMIDDPNQWNRARDLALLSLATYKGKGAQTEEDTETEAIAAEA